MLSLAGQSPLTPLWTGRCENSSDAGLDTFTSESSKPSQIRTYLHETLQKTKTDMYKFASQALLCELQTGTNLPKFAPPHGRHPSGVSTHNGGSKIG